MLAKTIRALILPLAMAFGLAACDDSGVQPGVVATAPSGYQGEGGRVMAIREVPIRSGQSGVSNGTLIGGGVGAAGGAVAGGLIGGNAGSAILGGVLGAVGGAVAGTAIDRNRTKRGIEVSIQKDDGQTVTIAQSDDGDVQMGDRVVIVRDRNGVARAVRDTSRRRD